ncbi:MAG: OmpH family outer membrane protein [Lentisphaeria bacterium]|nr:OmpH family outer membrane protein [Lentisphaeria bacterium]
MKSILPALFFATASLFAAETVGFINMEKVFNDYYKTVTENIKFEETRQKFVTALTVLQGEFENTRQEYEKAISDAENDLLSDSARAEAAQKARVLEARLEQKHDETLEFRQNGMAEIEGNQQQATQLLIDDLQAQLTKYAAERGLEMVYETSGRTMNRVPVLLVYPKEKEITEAFIKQVNAGHEKEKAESQAKLEAMHKAAQEKQQQMK